MRAITRTGDSDEDDPDQRRYPQGLSRPGESCGALLRGISLSQNLPADALVAAMRSDMGPTTRWSRSPTSRCRSRTSSVPPRQLGPFGEDTRHRRPISGDPDVIEVRARGRRDQAADLRRQLAFGTASLLPTPPAATALYGTIVPPVGGDTLFGRSIRRPGRAARGDQDPAARAQGRPLRAPGLHARGGRRR
jgi:hypothetical protein